MSRLESLMSKPLRPLLAMLAALLALALPLPPGAGAEPALNGYVALRPPVPVPGTPFISAGGQAIKLADWRGKAVLVNFWATWCAPCVKELPSLDRLQAALGGQDFEVVLVSMDRGGPAVYEPFLEKLGLKHLRSGSDPKGALVRELKAPGIPLTLLVDPRGMVVGKLLGSAEWDSAAAKALIKSYLGNLNT
jgi:thiol-disulfide isomerase/thioredoxin